MKDRTMNELLSVHYAKSSVAIVRLWGELHDETCTRYGSGPLTSGIGNATAAPDEIKDVLRQLSRNAARASNISLRYWRAAGRKLSTWCKYRDSLRSGK